MYLLDTNIPSELRLGARGNIKVRQWTDSVARELLYLSVVSITEFRFGALQRERTDPAQGRRLHRWIDEDVLPFYGDRLLPVNLAIAERSAQLHVLARHDFADMLIAATALVHDLTLVTRNTRHFEATGVRLLNPFLDIA